MKGTISDVQLRDVHRTVPVWKALGHYSGYQYLMSLTFTGQDGHKQVLDCYVSIRVIGREWTPSVLASWATDSTVGTAHCLYKDHGATKYQPVLLYLADYVLNANWWQIITRNPVSP